MKIVINHVFYIFLYIIYNNFKIYGLKKRKFPYQHCNHTILGNDGKGEWNHVPPFETVEHRVFLDRLMITGLFHEWFLDVGLKISVLSNSRKT